MITTLKMHSSWPSQVILSNLSNQSGIEICKNMDLNKYVYDKWKADKDRFHHGPWMQSFKIVRKQKLVINIVRKLETQLLQFPFSNDSANL